MEIITTHKNTDFDAFASVIAATLLYPDAVPVLPKSINPNVKYFLGIHKNLFDIKQSDQIDLDAVKKLIVVDTNNWRRLEGMGQLKERKDIEIILWDHHRPGDIEADWKRQEPVGAAITLLAGELKKRKIHISTIFSTLFLTGLYEDTGNLSFPSSQPEDAYAAGYLMSLKADLRIVTSFLKADYGEIQKKTLFEMLNTAKTEIIEGHTVSFNIMPIKGHVEMLSLVMHKYREIMNVEVAIGIFPRYEKNRCMVIGRSGSDRVDMGTIMQRLGGGGHPGAGSAMLKSVDPETIEKLIRAMMEGNRQTSVRIGDLMSFPVDTFDPGIKMEELRSSLRKKGFKGAPIMEEGRLIGMITRSDFKKIRKKSQWESPVKAFMKREVITVDPGMSPIQAARQIITKNIGHLPVVENGEIIGIVTRSDLMVYFYDLLPE
ncbi:CBS domain-containing protein [Desulfobacterales bacterium HSG16]|nr:CBS domain-containing protein [Desulfobacterales bacterium HSG16]